MEIPKPSEDDKRFFRSVVPEGAGIGMLPDISTGSLTELASALRRLRRRHARQRGDTELTYRELAAKSGYAHGVIGDYFSGKVLPSTDRLDVLLGLLVR